jgi:hypothetical protein
MQSVDTFRSLNRTWYLKIPIYVVTLVTLGVLWVMRKLLRRKGIIARMREEFNGPGLMTMEAKRGHLYSAGDKTIVYGNVEEHGYEASRKGWIVEMENFAESGQVDHMRQDSERYWRAITRLWEEGMK